MAAYVHDPQCYVYPDGTPRPVAPQYKRDLVGYGRRPPNPQWPGGARLAINFVINYEEVGNPLRERLQGGADFLSHSGRRELHFGRRCRVGASAEYGSRAGYWRLHRLFTERNMTCTVYACALALERNPEAAVSMVEAGWEIASHGYRWHDYQYVDEATEREHIRLAVEIQQRVTGSRPVGIYQGKPNENTLRLVAEEGGFLYNSDSYADDLPFWNTQYGRPILIIPYTLDNNDMRFAQNLEGDRFFHYLKDAFDVLYAEGETSPKMMSVGLHCRIVGRPGRALGLAKFLDYVKSHEKVWVCKRSEICDHWYRNHRPYSAKL